MCTVNRDLSIHTLKLMGKHPKVFAASQQLNARNLRSMVGHAPTLTQTSYFLSDCAPSITLNAALKVRLY